MSERTRLQELKNKAAAQARRKAKRVLGPKTKGKRDLTVSFNMNEWLTLFAAYRELGPPLKEGQVISVSLLQKFAKTTLFEAIKAKAKGSE